MALSFLTVLPIRCEKVDRTTAKAAMLLAPVAGLVLAAGGCAMLGLFGWAAHAPLLAAALALAVIELGSRGLHLDGFVDTVDGLASHKPAAEALAIMRRSDAGPLGMGAFGFLVLIELAALAGCLGQQRGALALTTAVVTGRLAITWSCGRNVPVAQGGTLGALVGRTVPPLGAAALTAITTCAAAGIGLTESWQLAVTMAAAVIVPLAAIHLWRAHIVRRLGGITGDVLGACCEVATALSLVVATLTLPPR